jgi:hypothetical protein
MGHHKIRSSARVPVQAQHIGQKKKYSTLGFLGLYTIDGSSFCYGTQLCFRCFVQPLYGAAVYTSLLRTRCSCVLMDTDPTSSARFSLCAPSCNFQEVAAHQASLRDFCLQDQAH